MANEWQVASIPLAGGQSESQAGIAVDPPEMLKVQNGEFIRDGRIQKRRGATKIADFPSTKYDASAILVHRGSARLHTSRGAHALHDTASSVLIGPEQNPGTLPCELTERPAVRQGQVQMYSVCSMESPTGSRTVLHLWRDNGLGQVWYMLVDGTTGSPIMDPTIVATGFRPRATACPANGTYAILWEEGVAGGTIKGKTVSATTGVLSGGTASMGATENGWDVVTDGSDNVQLVRWTSAASGLTLTEWSAGLTATGRSVTVAQAAATYGAATIVATPAELWVAGSFNDGADKELVGQVNLGTYTTTAQTASALYAANVNRQSLVYDSVNGIWLALSGTLTDPATAPPAAAGYMRVYLLGSGTALPAEYAEQSGHVLAAGGFHPGSKHDSAWWPTVYYAADSACRDFQAYGSVLYYASLTVEAAQGGSTTIRRMLPVARWGSDIAQTPLDSDADWTTWLAHSTARGATNFAFGGAVMARLKPFVESLNGGADVIPTYGRVASDLLGGDEVVVEPLPDPVRVEQRTPALLPLAAGGMLTSHDGLQMHEAALQAGPSRPYVAAFAGAGVASDKYRWRMCWRWVDSEGRIRRSAPSSPSLQADYTGANNPTSVTLRVVRPPPSVLVGVNGTHLTLEVYTQKAGLDAIYRLTDEYAIDTTATFSLNAWVSVTWSTFSPLADFQPLYTEGGEVANIAPPAALDVVGAGDRVWVLSGEDPTTLWPSKLAAEEQVQRRGPEWAKGLSLKMPGEVRALAALDDRLVAFGRDAIWLVEGSGPDNLLNGTAFSVRQLASEFGIRDPRSATTCAAGVAFRADRGIYLLGRDLTVSYIGGGVEATLGSSRVISALVVGSRSEVRMHLDKVGSQTAAKSLVWYYHANRWSYWTHGAGAAAVRSGSVERIEVTHTGVPGLYRETDGVYTDCQLLWGAGESPYASGGYLFDVITPHIRPQGRDAGHLSVLRAIFASDVAPDANSKGIQILWEKDLTANAAAPAGSATFSASDVSGAYHLEVTPAGTGGGLKCSTIRFEYKESVAAGNIPPESQASPTSVARLVLEMAALPGLLQGLPSTQRK